MLKKTLPVLAALAMTTSSIAITAPALADGVAQNKHVWWPESLDLSLLRQNGADDNPLDPDFNYAEEFASLDFEVLKTEITELMTTSQDWWPADYGHYGPFFIRLAWHSAGTYRVGDGRGGASGGQMRFEPLNSWPDNTNLDKARRLLWPIKQKYGNKISWADLMVLSGNIAMESMGFKTFGFAGGREDDWQAELVYWGPETEFLASNRHTGERKLEKPLAATRQGLIYVNPQGPNGVPDPVAAAQDIRVAFGRMAMDDEETVALIAGGHTFGKTHGARKPEECVGVEPTGAGVELQGEGWVNKCGTGKGADTITSGFEGAWTSAPTVWTTQFFDNLFAYEWVQTTSPGGAIQWIPSEEGASELVPDAFDADKRHAPIMLTTDLSLKFDPAYREISKRFHEDPTQFEDAFARAWFKLIHRDMGPRGRYVWAESPVDPLIWQDPVASNDHPLVDGDDIAALKAEILGSGLTNPELVRTAWAAAASFRATDMRGGANGARINLEPQSGWAVNNPEELSKVLTTLKSIRAEFNEGQQDGTQISLADIIVLGGAAAIEAAAADAGFEANVPFTPGRSDATQENTDVRSFAVLEPTFDGFRNYLAGEHNRSASELLVERADFLDLTVPEMTVLVGGLRALDANSDGAAHGVFTDRPGSLTNDFFLNLLDLSTGWQKAEGSDGVFEGRDRTSGELRWTATEVDLVFGSNAELRAIAEYYAYDDAADVFVADFIEAWTKVMNLDRF